MRFLVIPCAVLVAMSHSVAAQGAPAGYYDTVDDSNPALLRSTLHQIIDDHTRFPYTAGGSDTWNILNLAQQDPNDSGAILDVYRNSSYPKISGGTRSYNREHTWPVSYGFPDDGSTNYPFTDCHMLWLCDGGYNSDRSNKPFGYCSPGHTERTTLLNNSQGGGCCSYPGNSNWTSGSFSSGIWEVWIGRRGDVARALLYADLRYDGGTHNVTGAGEPDLILTDNLALVAASNTGNNEAVAYMGELSVLLQWHLEDPVDAFERNRNDVVYGFQGNRNPFVDNPDWVDCLYNGVCGTPPPEILCTAKLASAFCLPSIAFSGTPSLTDPNPFDITASMIINNKNGLLFYGYGATSLPFLGGTLCAMPPLRRMSIQNSGGNLPPNDCSGTYSLDFNAHIQAGSDPFLAVGQEAVCQWWFRDPQDFQGFGAGLSNGVRLTVGP